ncbi:MAG: phosphotriesterase [Bacteroidota bacterium]
MKIYRYPLFVLLVMYASCTTQQPPLTIVDISGANRVDTSKVWLSHEHLLVDFIGADSINPTTWNRDSIIQEMLPYFKAIANHGVDYFVDATPSFLGRDIELLQRMSEESSIKIITNTGLYGAVNNKYIPQSAKAATAEELAQIWTDEFNFGINQTQIKPGFMKIGVDNTAPLEPIDAKLVKAAALTHLQTGLTIASHTGKALGMWPQLAILREHGVSPEAFIWVHAQNEQNVNEYLKAAKTGCWISLDGLGWETNYHVAKLVFAKENGFLDRILISHDAGWYDPQKKVQAVQPYTNIFEKVIPKLYEKGFSQADIDLLLKYNPAKAFAIEIRKME